MFLLTIIFSTIVSTIAANTYNVSNDICLYTKTKNLNNKTKIYRVKKEENLKQNYIEKKKQNTFLIKI